MLRADRVICGTSSTGTGTLTLAATPVPPGGVDFDVFARATGIGFGNSAAVLVSYVVIEYTSSAFVTAKQYEKGIGTLTLGGSSGITNATLARTLVQSKATSMDSQPATPTYASPTAITIGTAANTLVFIGPSTTDTMAFDPFVDSTGANATGWVGPMTTGGINGTANDADICFENTLEDYYLPFYWVTPMLVKRLGIDVRTAYSGGTSNAYGRIYQVGSNGQPGRLLYDFGLLGTSNASLSASGPIDSGASGNGFFLTPGAYYLDLIASYSGGSGVPTVHWPTQYIVTPPVLSADHANFSFGRTVFGCALATGGTAGAAPVTANLTGFIQKHMFRSAGFALKAS